MIYSSRYLADGPYLELIKRLHREQPIDYIALNFLTSIWPDFTRSCGDYPVMSTLIELIGDPVLNLIGKIINTESCRNFLTSKYGQALDYNDRVKLIHYVSLEAIRTSLQTFMQCLTEFDQYVSKQMVTDALKLTNSDDQAQVLHDLITDTDHAMFLELLENYQINDEVTLEGLLNEAAIQGVIPILDSLVTRVHDLEFLKRLPKILLKQGYKAKIVLQGWQCIFGQVPELVEHDLLDKLLYRLKKVDLRKRKILTEYLMALKQAVELKH